MYIVVILFFQSQECGHQELGRVSQPPTRGRFSAIYSRILKRCSLINEIPTTD